MSRDIVDTSGPSERLVVAARIEGQPADQLACLGIEYPDDSGGDQELDRLSFVGPAQADVVELESWRRVTVRPCEDLNLDFGPLGRL